MNTIERWLKSWWLEWRIFAANHVISHVPLHWVRLAYYRRIMHFSIGKGSSIHLGAWLDIPRGLVIGNDVTINQNCRLDSRGGLRIGDRVSISSDCILLSAGHDVQSPGFDGVRTPVEVADYVFIGTRSTILPGVKIGEGAVIGAGSIVTKNVEPYAVVAGAPARVIGQRSRDLDYRPTYRRWLH